MFGRLRNWFSSKKLAVPVSISSDNIPNHVAIIMDGNGRWAKKRGLPRIAGHRTGMKTVKKITIAANDLGVKVLTLYAFSTENWKRPRDEVDFLMKLPQEFLSQELHDLDRRNIQVKMIGWEDGLPDFTLKAVREAVEKTKHNTGLILNFALNYGSRKEIIHSIKEIVSDIQKGTIKSDQINESLFSSYMQTADLPDPDLLIRTSGELRISNFLLWQLAYSELWFTDIYWPGFTEDHFYEAIMEYQRRTRRYGAIQ